MQILPTIISSNQTLWNAASNNRPDDEHASSFLDVLNSSLKGVEESAGEAADLFGTAKPVKSAHSTSAATATTARAAVQVQSPYSRNTSNGVTYTLDEVCFTKQEVKELYNDLLKAGASPDSLSKLAALAEMPDGATLAQVTASVKGGNGTPVLTDEDKTNITTLLKKVDPSGVLDTNVQTMMMQGNAQQAFNTISAFVNKLDPAGSLEVTQDEAISLGRGLGLGTSNLQTLVNSFGGNASITCLNEQFGTLMAPVTDFFTSQVAAQKTLDTALKTTLQPRISKARARTEKEKQANSLRDRTAQQSKVLIDKTVRQKTNNILGETLEAGHQTETGDVKVAAQSEMIGKDDNANSRQAHTATDNKSTAAQRAPQAEKIAEPKASPQTPVQQAAQQSSQQSSQTAQQASQPQQTLQPAQQQAKPDATNQAHAQAASQQAAALDDKGQKHADSNSGSEADKDQKDKSSWGELLNKVDVKSATATGHGNAAAYAASQAAQNTQAVQNASADVLDAATVAPIGRQVAQQVEQGMLSTVKGGGTRLDLQLNPQELGTINVTLSVRNGEVSAIIRSEKSETADMINRQVDVIRTNLEQQGLKVDKVEVRQETPQEQNSTTWQDFNQHNTRQEEDARREELARLKNLASVRNASINSEISTLEQPVHSLGNTARYATSNLNVVA